MPWRHGKTIKLKYRRSGVGSFVFRFSRIFIISTGAKYYVERDRIDFGGETSLPAFSQTGKDARVSGMDAYKALCDEASREPDEFWARLARENLVWNKPFTKVLAESEAPFYKWSGAGELTV